MDKALVIIPARGGSKGLPGKNGRLLRGKPMLLYTVEAARAVFSDQQILVSTDDPALRKTVEASGLPVPFLRPPALATDTATSQSVLLHGLKWVQAQGYDPEVVIMLQPTSPLRTATHLREALAVYTPDLDMVVSVKETASNPYYVLFEENENGFLEKSKASTATRRQEVPKVWEYNGAIYIINVHSLKSQPMHAFTRIKKYVMDEYSSIDIDTELDFHMAEWILAHTS